MKLKPLFNETGAVKRSLPLSAILLSLLMIQGCGSSNSSNSVDDNIQAIKTFSIQTGNDANRQTHPLLNENPNGPGGSPNQSLRSGDILQGTIQDDLLIGGLGVDILMGNDGDDILIGGTEDFNSSVDGDGNGSDNRDRAFGQAGDDVFIWAPGDGSDFFDGGEGTDVVIFGIIGEQKDANGSTEGAPFFNVNASGEGSNDFDGIFTDEYGAPQVRVSNTPGFCSFVNSANYVDEFESLNIDQIVRFTLRNIANAFDAGDREDDDGLRVALSIKNTEFVVCTQRDFDEANGMDNVEVFDLRSGVPEVADISDLPTYIQLLIK